MKPVSIRNLFLFFVATALGMELIAEVSAKPNVILIITDDLGYGDIAAHGNPVLKTPNLDKLHGESLRLTQFHVNPYCTPTRAALMTGRYPERTGAYHTTSGRSMMHADEITAAEIFAANGYTTGLIGKWHLGDNAPHRPQDRGFQEVLWHKAGGIGQGPDHWGNTYFNDTYERASAHDKQGRAENFKGYCTDVWFDEATRFVKRHQDQPFFLYLSTNVPHGPFRVRKQWSNPYSSLEGSGLKEFYGMIANLDYNLGIFRQKLQEFGLAENTIIIFMSDNGTARGADLYNAGMRGQKATLFDGGHRVPFFLHWPEGKLAKPQDIGGLAAHIDVLPTLVELCRLQAPEAFNPDGVSFSPLLKNPKATMPRSPLVVQLHGGPKFKDPVEPFSHSAVLYEDWRLLNGKQLFNIENDRKQERNVAEQYPEVVEQLRSYYDEWWKSVSKRMVPVRIDLGNSAENPITLNSQDWYMDRGQPPWSQGQIKKLPKTTGPWMVDIKYAGEYRVTLRQLPEVADRKSVV